MKNNILRTLLVLMLVLTASSTSHYVYAKDGVEDTSDDTSHIEDENEAEEHKDKSQFQELKTKAKDNIKAIRAENKAERKDMRASGAETRKNIENEIKTLKASGASEAEIKAKVDTLKQSIATEREALKARLDEKRKTAKAEISKEIESFKNAKKVKLDETKKTNVKNKLNAAFTKLSAAIARLGGFDSKVSAAIDARKAKGLDTSKAEEALVSARGALEDAKVSLEAVNQATKASIDSTQGTSAEAIKSVVLKTQTAIKTAHAKYVDVLNSLPEESTQTTN